MRSKKFSYSLMGRRKRSKHLSKKNEFRLWLIKCISLLLAVVALIILLCLLLGRCSKSAPEKAPESQSTEAPAATPLFCPAYSVDTAQLDQEIQSQFAVIIDAKSGSVLADRSGTARMDPASMTKVLTLLVAAEEITDKSGSFLMTEEIADYCYINECSVVGYEVGDQVPVSELFYGCILSSGADASLALAELACGSHEAFVAKMNQKIEELGREKTAHFTNCVGIYNEEHYCTVLDMAVFMKAALENDFCKKVLSTKKFNCMPSATNQEGQTISNWFLRRIEDRDILDVAVLGAKTGFVAKAGSCAVSYAENSKGEGFICASGKGSSSWQAIADHVAIYRQYAATDLENENIEGELSDE